LVRTGPRRRLSPLILSLAGGFNAYKVDLQLERDLDPFGSVADLSAPLRAPNVAASPRAELVLSRVSHSDLGAGGDPCNYHTNAARQGQRGSESGALPRAGSSGRLIILLQPATPLSLRRRGPRQAQSGYRRYPYPARVRFRLRSHPLSAGKKNAGCRWITTISPYLASLVSLLAAGPPPGENKCFNLYGSNPILLVMQSVCACSLETPTDGQVASVLQETQNLGAIKTRGVDLQLDWLFRPWRRSPDRCPGDPRLHTVPPAFYRTEGSGLSGRTFADFTIVGTPTGVVWLIAEGVVAGRDYRKLCQKQAGAPVFWRWHTSIVWMRSLTLSAIRRSTHPGERMTTFWPVR